MTDVYLTDVWPVGVSRLQCHGNESAIWNASMM